MVIIRFVIFKADKSTTICVSRRNHDFLMTLGKKGDSFDDILTQVLDKIKPLQVTVMSGELNYLPVMGESTQSDSLKEQQRADG